MADKEKKASGKAKVPLSVRFAFFMVLVTAMVFLPSTIVLTVCLIPTMVAAIIDNQQQKTAWLTVGAMNLAGTVPGLFTLWDMGHTIPAALKLVSDPMIIMVSFGGSAAGWLIYYNVTPFVAGIILSKNEKRFNDIDKRQKELVKKWGSEVISG